MMMGIVVVMTMTGARATARPLLPLLPLLEGLRAEADHPRGALLLTEAAPAAAAVAASTAKAATNTAAATAAAITAAVRQDCFIFLFHFIELRHFFSSFSFSFSFIFGDRGGGISVAVLDSGGSRGGSSRWTNS